MAGAVERNPLAVQPGQWHCNEVISSSTFSRDKAGASSIEYALIAAGISATLVPCAECSWLQPQC
ncbi:Flp family type IVb pilin [Bradyrhizobium hereditatis]|uniref:Flp family type IVb pilin n=1 Tax=Bradyrhizobium hereditatis TaxID=2821405 RepID=UPI0035DE7426